MGMVKHISDVREPYAVGHSDISLKTMGVAAAQLTKYPLTVIQLTLNVLSNTTVTSKP